MGRLTCVGLSLLSLLPLGLTGCSLSAINSPTSAEAGAALQGRVNGGQQPIVGAQVYLFAAGTGGYGGAGIAASSSNASTSLLHSGAGTTLDSSGGATNGDYYVTTDASGNFSITGDYTCTANTQVYVYALGGNPGAGANAAAGLMAALGNCPGTGNFQTATPYILVNEVSTVAAAYAMAGYASDALHVSSSGTAAAKRGIANAFLNADELETLSTGSANSSPPAGVGSEANGPGVMPQAEINTLGNVLAACVNSNGAVTGPSNPTACYTLFTNAMSNGTSGTQPTDTATAAINIAHNPAAAVSALYGLSSAYAQFNPTLTSQPNDFTVSILFQNENNTQGGPLAVDSTGDVWIALSGVDEINSQGYDPNGGLGYSGFSGATNVALDANENAWAINANAVGEFSNSGTLLSPTNGWSSGLGLSSPTSIAMDGAGNAWIGDGPTHSVVKVSSAGALSGTFTGSGLTSPGPVAIDASGNAWIADLSSGAVVKLSNAGSALSGSNGYTGLGLNTPTGIAIDHSGNVWVTNSGGVVEVSSAGALLSPSGGYTGGGISSPQAVAVDGAGNIWTVSGSAVTELSSAGAALSGSTGYSASNQVNGIAVDASGDVWVNYVSFNFLYGYSYYFQEFVGAAAPVVTPISLGVKNNTLGTRP